MATDPKIPGNMVTNERGAHTALTSAYTLYFPTVPQVPLAVNVHKNGQTCRVDTTTTASKEDGTKLADLEDSDVLWNTVSTSASTDNYFAGDSQLVTGVRIHGFSNSSSSQIEFSITQKKGRN